MKFFLKTHPITKLLKVDSIMLFNGVDYLTKNQIVAMGDLLYYDEKFEEYCIASKYIAILDEPNILLRFRIRTILFLLKK